MDQITREDIRQLFKWRGGACVSIYLPTVAAGADTRQDQIRLKNLLNESESRLISRGLRSVDAWHILESPRGLLDDGLFWVKRSGSLAVFAADDLFRYFRLPLKFEELSVVADRFHLKPLLSMLTGDGRFAILALSQHAARLLECSRFNCREVEIEDIPQGVESELENYSLEKQIQSHTGAAINGSRRDIKLHGHGAGADDHTGYLLNYLRRVDESLCDRLKGERIPLVLAGVDYLQALYKEASSYPRLTENGVPGNPEGLRPEELHQQAWDIVEPVFRKSTMETIKQYRQLASTSRASGDLETVVPAACRGRVDSLLVGVGVQAWGVYDNEDGTIRLHPEENADNQDLLDLAAMETLKHGGKVFAVPPGEVPGEASLAAIFRY